MGGYTVLFMYFVEKETEILEEFMCFIESIFPRLHARSNAVGNIAAFPHWMNWTRKIRNMASSSRTSTLKCIKICLSTLMQVSTKVIYHVVRFCSLNEPSDLQAARTQSVDEKLLAAPFVGNTYTATSSAAAVAQERKWPLIGNVKLLLRPQLKSRVDGGMTWSS